MKIRIRKCPKCKQSIKGIGGIIKQTVHCNDCYIRLKWEVKAKLNAVKLKQRRLRRLLS